MIEKYAIYLDYVYELFIEYHKEDNHKLNHKYLLSLCYRLFYGRIINFK